MAETETVYGTHEDSPVPMSEGVQTLAAGIYKEFEQMMKKYDEDVVHTLTPLIINVLESLEKNVSDKLESEAEIELIKDDNEQLLTQYEREKQLRKTAEQKYLELEDIREEEIRDETEKIESMESVLRMSELKSKNTIEQIIRLENKEKEAKKDYDKLHERYTDLFKTHMEYAERTKMLMTSDRMGTDIALSPKTKTGFMLPNSKLVIPTTTSLNAGSPTSPQPEDYIGMATTPGRTPYETRNTSLQKEFNSLHKNRKRSKSHSDTGVATDSISTAESSTTMVESTDNENSEKQGNLADSSSETLIRTSDMVNSETNTASIVEGDVFADPNVNGAKLENSIDDVDKGLYLVSPYKHILDDIVATTPELEEFEESIATPALGKLNIHLSANETSLFEELTFETDLISEMDDGVDITGKAVAPAEFSSSENDSEDELQSAVSENFFGMGREVDNLIQENKDLMATKNALNVVKDDLIARLDEMNSEQEMLKQQVDSLEAVKSRLKLRVTELEGEVKKVKDDFEKKSKPEGEEDEDIPMSHRKRFTRVEMARVLMERNQYKERLMELQEAVRWTEMIRASRDHPEIVQSKKKSSGLWNFFGSLFSGSSKPEKRKTLPDAKIHYNAPTTHVQPVGDPNKKKRTGYNLGEKGKAYEFMQDEKNSTSEKVRKERDKERKEQYKQVRAHVKKDNGRMQAYGWSLPTKFQAAQRDTQSKSVVPVPVPVYCRPLLDKESGMKLWCAAGVNLTGGKTRDGGSIVGGSIFYSNPPSEPCRTSRSDSDLDKLNNEIQEHEKGVKELQREQQMSSFVWICTSTHSCSRVTVIDANNPSDVLETFKVASSHILCIASVPGAKENDYPGGDNLLNEEESAAQSRVIKDQPQPQPQPQTASTPNTDHQTPKASEDSNQDGADIGNITFVQCATGVVSKTTSAATSPIGSFQDSSEEFSEQANTNTDIANITKTVDGLIQDSHQHVEDNGSSENKGDPLGVCTEESLKCTVTSAKASPVSSGSSTPSSDGHHLIEPTELVKDGLRRHTSDNPFLSPHVEKTSSVLPTMWLGFQSGSLYVHSAVSSWRTCLHSVKLCDSILQIVHIKGRVMVALANGTVAIFHRGQEGQWDLTNYHSLDLGKPHHSIRCMTIVANKHVWCGYRNKIHIVNPKNMKVDLSFDVHPRKESQVRQLTWVGDGVWVSIRLDSTLRLYHAYTHQHLQDVDIEPYVSKMLGTGKLGFSFVRITSLMISCSRLWIGTGNGVIISVPLSESNKQMVGPVCGSGHGPGGVVRVYAGSTNDSVTPGSFIPYCSMSQAQLSFHGHRDAVKFFVAVPGLGSNKGISAAAGEKTQLKNTLIMSGGEGYIDFRLGDGDDGDEDDSTEDEQKQSLSIGDRSHLIVWEITNTTT